MGEADNFFLEQAVHRFDDAVSRLTDPPFAGTNTYGPGEGHCWMGISEAELMRRMDARIRAGEPPAVP